MPCSFVGKFSPIKYLYWMWITVKPMSKNHLRCSPKWSLLMGGLYWEGQSCRPEHVNLCLLALPGACFTDLGFVNFGICHTLKYAGIYLVKYFSETHHWLLKWWSQSQCHVWFVKIKSDFVACSAIEKGHAMATNRRNDGSIDGYPVSIWHLTSFPILLVSG